MALVHLEVRDAVAEDATGSRPRLEDTHFVTADPQDFCDGEAGGAGTDDSDALAGGRRDAGKWSATVVALVVGDERLEPSDRDWDGLLTDDAVAFAERFLRAEAAAHVGRGVRRPEDLGRAVDVAVLELEEGARDVVADGAGDLAGSGRALDAAVRLDLGRVEVVAFVDLEPVVDALFRLLLGYRLVRHLQARLAVNAFYGFCGCHRHFTSIVGRGGAPSDTRSC